VEKESAPALKALGLEPAVAVRKLQLLTLVSLAHDAGGADITFATIAQATELPIEEVEELVLDAIAAGLLDARMDELRAVVRVGRCLHRTFGKAQWSKLHAELGQWRTTIQAVLEVMGTAPVAV
jgi:translation initiation factor 3 subunit M